MDLKTYLTETGETQTAFAKRARTTVATISRILSSSTFTPGVDLALRIEEKTDGKVDAALLNKDVARVRQAAA